MGQVIKNGLQVMVNFPSQGSIYWFNPDSSQGAELRKVWPCVIVSPAEMNMNIRTVIIVPLTSMVRPWDFRLTVKIAGQNLSLTCDQIIA